MSELVFGKEVELRSHTIDRYGRLVARVLVNGQDAGLELLKQGLCWVYEKYIGESTIDFEASYRAAEAVARSDKLGLWQDPDPTSLDFFGTPEERDRLSSDLRSALSDSGQSCYEENRGL